MSKNSNFVFGITINEIIIVLFFLLALLSSFKLNEQNEKNNELIKTIQEKDEKYKEQEELITLIKDNNQKINQYFDELVNIHKYKNRIAILEKEILLLNQNKTNLVELNKINKNIEKEIEKNKELLKILTQKDNKIEIKKLLEKCHEINNNKLEQSSLEQKLIECNKKSEEYDNFQDQKEELTNTNNKLKEKLAFYERRGLDLPPCWIKNGKAEYLFDLTFNPQDIYVEASNWTEENIIDVNKMQNISKLINQNMSMESFMMLVKPIFQESVKMECRHFVKIIDKTNNNKKEFNKKRFLIESYFYKYEVRD